MLLHPAPGTLTPVFNAVDCRLSYAGEKNWSGGGDGSLWADEDNWSPGTEPSAADTVTISAEDASVLCDRTFEANDLILGGRETVTLTVDEYIYGEIEPSAATEVAVLNRSGGNFVLKGSSGTVTRKGTYKDSETTTAEEPSFIFWVE